MNLTLNKDFLKFMTKEKFLEYMEECYESASQSERQISQFNYLTHLFKEEKIK